MGHWRKMDQFQSVQISNIETERSIEKATTIIKISF